MTGVIDIMNYAPLVAPGLSGTEYQFDEFQTMVRTTLRPLLRNGIVTTQWGREVDVAHPPTEPDPTLNIDGALAELDRTGCDAAVLACVKMWSYRSHHRLIMDMPEEVVAEAVQKGGGRFIGGAGYNPFRIDDSLRRIETFVRDHGFRYVYFHPMTFGLAPNDRRCYPLYAKCAELGIPVGLQVGHSAEPLPSNVGRPMLVDDVAIDFPDLKINLSHTGWPWTGEFISMLWRHPNVYGDGPPDPAQSHDRKQRPGPQAVRRGAERASAAGCQQGTHPPAERRRVPRPMTSGVATCGGCLSMSEEVGGCSWLCG